MVGGWLSSIGRFRDSASVHLVAHHLLGPWSTLPPTRGRGKKEQGMYTYFLSYWGNDTITPAHIPLARVSHTIPYRFREKGTFPPSIPFTTKHLWMPFFLDMKKNHYPFKEVNSELHSVISSNSKFRKFQWRIILSIRYECNSSSSSIYVCFLK